MTTRDGDPGSAGGSPLSTWDDAMIEELRSLQEPGEDDLVAELVRTFLDDAGPSVPVIEAAAAGGDVAEVVRAAHRLKGGAASVGARRLAAAAGAIEDAARRGEGALVRLIAPGIRAEFERFARRTRG